MDAAQELVSLGLTDAEARVYTVLHRSGTQSLAALSKKTRLPTRTLAKSLPPLEKRGIVSRARSGKNLLFTAEDPKLLAERLAEEERKISQKKDAIGKLLEPLRGSGVRTAAKPVVHFFAGQEAARVALGDTLTAKEKRLRAFFSTADLTEFLGAEFFEDYTRRRIAAGLILSAVRTFERDKRKTKTNKYAKMFLSSKEEKREVRFISEDLAFPLTLFLYDQKILGIASKEENFAFIIESKELFQMQKKLFELTWRAVAIRSIPTGK